MNWWLILITFLAVNLDFFFILLFLLDKYRLQEVMAGYIIGILLLVTASFLLGKALAAFLPEWLLGCLGILPIYIALHDNDDDPASSTLSNPILATLTTYLAVCAGCNLSIFLPVLTGVSLQRFVAVLVFVGFLAGMMVILIYWIGRLPLVKNLMERYSEILMKVIYIGVGLYVFWDNGLVSHLLGLL